MSTTSMCFSINGDYLTNLFRNLFLEEGYQKAFDIFNESFCGDIDVKYLNDILECKGKLVGVNNLDYQPDSWSDNLEYKKNYDYTFKGLVYIDGKYYRPFTVVTSWVKDDAIYAMNYYRGKGVTLRDSIYFVPCNKECTPAEVRSHYYVQNHPVDVKPFSYKNAVYFFEDVQVDIPYYMCKRFKRSFETALKEYLTKPGRTLNVIDPIKKLSEDEKRVEHIMDIKASESRTYKETRNFIEDYDYIREEESTKCKIEFYKKEILDRNGDDWVNINYVYEDTRKTVKIPAKPFHQWCIGSGRMISMPRHDENSKKIDQWTPCTMSGLKMFGDNPYHTDWLIGAGLDPTSWYDDIKRDDEYESMDSAIWQYAFDFCIKLETKEK